MQRKNRRQRRLDQRRRVEIRSEVRTDLSAELPWFADTDATWEKSKERERV